MRTVFDYIDYYKNETFDDYKFNDMDNIVFSTLAYLPLEGLKDKITIDEIGKMFEKKPVDLRSMKKVAFKVLDVIKGSKRYGGIVISNYVSVLDETQFSAMTIRYKKGECYVAYRGTDNSLVGWRENFELSYKYPVGCQKLAIDYLKKTIKPGDKVIYVGGHSKGGNLAMTAAMECVGLFYKIKTIYNNDGPGFREKEYNSIKYKKIKEKIKTFIPEESMVGIILLRDENYIVVKSKEHGPYQHYLSNWLCFGSFLEPGKLSKYSVKVQEQINDYVMESSSSDRELMVKTLFDVLEKQNIKYFYEIRNMSFKDFSLLIKDAKDVDEKSKDVILAMIKGLVFGEVKKSSDKVS